jgi:hypothetical protein
MQSVFNALSALAQVVLIACVPFLVPLLFKWLNSKLDAQQRHAFLTVVNGLVDAAEQSKRAFGWDGQAAHDYVINMAQAYCDKRGLKLSVSEIDAAIEQTVWNSFNAYREDEKNKQAQKVGMVKQLLNLPITPESTSTLDVTEAKPE